MSLRDEVKDWLKEGKEIKAKNPLCSKRLVVDNLWEVYGLLEDEFGGIYCDSDCKPIQSFDLILNKLNEDITFFTGLKPTQNNNTLFDCTVYGSAPNSRMIKQLLDTT